MRSGSGPSILKTQGQRNKKEQQKYFANTRYSLSLPISFCHSVSLYFYLFLSISICLSLCISVSLYLCLPQSLSLTKKFNKCTVLTVNQNIITKINIHVFPFFSITIFTKSITIFLYLFNFISIFTFHITKAIYIFSFSFCLFVDT